MRIARVDIDGLPQWGVIRGDGIDLLHGSLPSWAPALTSDFTASLPFTGRTLSLDSARLIAPVEHRAKVLAAGATYAKHVTELGHAMPDKPATFQKPYESLIGPNDDIQYPVLTQQLDYEVELVVVIGKAIRSGDEASHAILGYCVGNDVSARDLQFGGSISGMDFFSGKGLDDTSGIGPWITTRDEFGDGKVDLQLTLTVDGDLRQSDRTSSLVWEPSELVEYVVARSRLSPGDVLFTGTPAGVALEDGRYLTRGQVVEATIERLGTLRNTVV